MNYYQSYPVMKILHHDDMQILLLQKSQTDLLPKDSIANVIALDKDGNLLWTIQRPHTNHDIYRDIYFHGRKFFAITRIGQLHEIEINSGQIIKSMMTK